MIVSGFPGPGGTAPSACTNGIHQSVPSAGGAWSVESGWSGVTSLTRSERSNPGRTWSAERVGTRQIGSAEAIFTAPACLSAGPAPGFARTSPARYGASSRASVLPASAVDGTANVRAPNTIMTPRRFKAANIAPVSKTAFVGIGSNLGDREDNLRLAVELLSAEDGVDVTAVSEIRETEPVGPVEQGPFLNGAVRIETELGPRELLERLLAVEQRLGRVREERWGPRTIDLDLLLYGDEAVDEPGLTVPHPRLHERRFVLEPLADLAPSLEIPGRGPISALLAELE